MENKFCLVLSQCITLSLLDYWCSSYSTTQVFYMPKLLNICSIRSPVTLSHHQNYLYVVGIPDVNYFNTSKTYSSIIIFIQLLIIMLRS
jgi:hypothetical protein